ncbi:MAG: CopG family transcriptional regulator [Clostridia bacterium]|nr:CopG family transcriptional regulator [Clostridia bacterium]
MKLAVIGIIINGDRSVAENVNKILSSYGDFIVCRMGVPDRVNNIYVISIIVRAELEVISALSGKLGRLSSVKVKSAITDADINEN